MMDGGLFITDSVTLSRTSKICSLTIQEQRLNLKGSSSLTRSSRQLTGHKYIQMAFHTAVGVLPCLLVHGFMHDKAAVDVQDSLAHVDVLLQKDLDVIGWFQEENIRGVGDKGLEKRHGITKGHQNDFMGVLKV